MKNENNNQLNFSNQKDLLMWLKRERYNSGNIPAKSPVKENLMWLKVEEYNYNNAVSQSQSAEISYSSVDVFFRALYLL